MMKQTLPWFVALAMGLSMPLLSARDSAADAGAAPPKAAPAKVDEVVAKVQAFYDRTSSFGSNFRQEFWVKLHNVKKTSTGHVVFVKPGKMDWQYDDPKGNRVVSDGALIRVYEHGNKQMYEQPVDKTQYPAALAFLTGTGKLADAFTFELFDGEKMAFPGGVVLVGMPKTATPAYQKVLFYVDVQSSQVRRVMILDGQGNRNRFDFDSPSVNDARHKKVEFKFVPPPGTTILRP